MYSIPRPETSPGVRQREDEVSGRGVMLSIFLRNLVMTKFSRPRKLVPLLSSMMIGRYRGRVSFTDHPI